MIPGKLKIGDEIRVISPARSMAIISEETRRIAKQRLEEELGFRVTFSDNVEEADEFNSSSIQSRVDDIHEAFFDKNVKGILTTIGGFSSNQLLKYLDYDLIKSNPKVLCGYSDITALSNAIYAKTGLVTYSGPHFSTFGMLKGFDFTMECFKKCLMQDNPFEVMPSLEWSDDAWYIDQQKRDFIKNDGYFTINPGEADGRIVGGNLCTLNLLQGTEYFPDLTDTIVFMEDDSESQRHHFDRDLQSLIHQPGFNRVKGIVIGRFQNDSKVPNEILVKIIKTKTELNNIPVIAGVDFGHTYPLITYPIGGIASLSASASKIVLKIAQH
jgi:muramoyltetrapeptide carboxypeptidase